MWRRQLGIMEKLERERVGMMVDEEGMMGGVEGPRGGGMCMVGMGMGKGGR